MSLWTWLFPPRQCDLDHRQVREAVHKHRNSMMTLQAAVAEDKKVSRMAHEQVVAASKDFESKAERILRMADDAIQYIEESKVRGIEAENANKNQ